MASYNKVILMGNLTRDPELKVLQGGSTVCEFGMAMNESWTDKSSGEKMESVCFVDVDIWGKQAETVDKFFEKGKPILVEGSLRYESWESEDGNKRSRIKVRAQRFSFVGSNTNGSTNGNTNGDSVPSEPTSSPGDVVDKDESDDIPF